MASGVVGEEVRNKQVILKDYVSGFPKESDMQVINGTMKLKLQEGSHGIVVKNLYLSCDPYMRIRMARVEGPNVFTSYTPGSPLTGFGVAKVLDSGHPNFKKGDLIWGTTSWEEYSLITELEGLFKIEHTDVPLSYYTGILELQGPAMASNEATNRSTHTSPESNHDQSMHTNSNSPNTSTSVTPNPYFLNTSENPGNILVTQPLLGMRNYQSWSRAMVLALTAKKKIGFVNGKIVKPDLESPLYEDWESCNTMVLSWMINSMHVDVSSNIMYCETAREMWIELQNVFSQGNGPKIYNLQTEISQIRQNQMSVTEFYTKFKRLWDQLLNYEPMPECSCGAMKTLSNAHSKAYVMRFLMGLNEVFDTVRSQILMMDPFPTMSKVYSLILQEESHKNPGHGGSGSSQSDTMAMYANSKGNFKGNGRKERPFCTHCNMAGHTIEKCYKLHGYPPGYKPKGKPTANANQASFNSGDSVLTTGNQFPISKAQCEKLLAFLNSGTTGTGTALGDTHHAANASISCMATGAGGVSGEGSGLIGSSSQSQVNNYPVFNPTLMSGMPGLTAYAGFYEVCSPKKGEYVFISAASGAVGQLVGQFAKLMGCYVVGSAGSKEKVDLIRNKFGFDEAFNYKEETDLDGALKRYFPEGIDIYFENVGGKMLDAVLLNMRDHGRIAVCGMVSQYNLVQPEGVQNLMCLIYKRIHMDGFAVFDYYNVYPKFLDVVLPYIREGKIKYVEDIAEGLESGPAALVGLYSGRNVGKQVVLIARE